MTRNELKDIIKECLIEEVNNSNNSELSIIPAISSTFNKILS